MDIFAGGRYFSSQVLQLAKVYPLIKYSACAVAAKQLGQRKSPLSAVGVTSGQKRVVETLLTGRLDFLWYGAKYYGRAIQLQAARIMDEDPARDEGSVPSPSQIYWAAASPQFTSSSGEADRTLDLRLLAACILT